MNSELKKEEMEKKFEKYLDREDKAQIIIQIKSDLIDKYVKISILEIEILSNNIFDFCCLFVNQISESEIYDYISYKNTCYYDSLSYEDRKKIGTVDYKSLKKIAKKYIKLFK